MFWPDKLKPVVAKMSSLFGDQENATYHHWSIIRSEHVSIWESTEKVAYIDVRVEREALCTSSSGQSRGTRKRSNDTYNSVVAGAVVGCRVDEVVLNAEVFSGEIPAPCNGLDDLEIPEKAIRYIECGQLWTQYLYNSRG